MTPMHRSNKKWGKRSSRQLAPVDGFMRLLEWAGLRDKSFFLVCLVSLFVKWATGIWGYSGQGIGPLFGDYEAQRHWMEITLHKDISQWYRYDLEYWGLDYPPLTAYVSWVCGIVANFINPAWVALDVSRGYEDEASKVFMRSTVIVGDFFIYTPAVFYIAKILRDSRDWKSQRSFALLVLLQPALILIDHGHFQYNSIMLGFALWAVYLFAKDRDVLGSVMFCLSLGFKQMALYYAPAIFAYLLAKSFSRKSFQGTIVHIFKLGSVVLVTFAVLFSPFLTSWADIQQVITRLFPFGRGIFEDKVANFWCTLNFIYKLKKFPIPLLGKMSLATTLLALLPCCTLVLMRPTPRALMLSMASSSLAFFLFSFQVHEKSILLPLLPISLFLQDSQIGEWAVFFNNMATFSMYRLLKREGQIGPYVILTAFWNYLHETTIIPKHPLLKILVPLSYTAALIAHLLELIYDPPSRYPYFYSMVNVLISAPIFGVTWLYFIYQQWLETRHSLVMLEKKIN